MKQRIKDGSKAAYKRGRKGIVVAITSDKMIQAGVSTSFIGVFLSWNEAVAAWIQRLLAPYLPFYVPVKFYAGIGALLLATAFFWADRNTDEWREYVRETTGEETAEDTATDEDVAGEQK